MHTGAVKNLGARSTEHGAHSERVSITGPPHPYVLYRTHVGAMPSAAAGAGGGLSAAGGLQPARISCMHALGRSD